MQPVHVVVPCHIRQEIEETADAEGVSLGTVARELLAEALKARSLME
jgi:hypothetical protein